MATRIPFLILPLSPSHPFWDYFHQYITFAPFSQLHCMSLYGHKLYLTASFWWILVCFQVWEGSVYNKLLRSSWCPLHAVYRLNVDHPSSLWVHFPLHSHTHLWDNSEFLWQGGLCYVVSRLVPLLAILPVYPVPFILILNPSSLLSICMCWLSSFIFCPNLILQLPWCAGDHLSCLKQRKHKCCQMQN